MLCVLSCLAFCPTPLYADAPIADGVYYITNSALEGYLGLGQYHNVDAYIYYVTDGSEKTADAYWVLTNTSSGYTIRNEATGQLLVFTYAREDQYYKYMTLASESLGDQSEYWNIIAGSDGAFSVQSALDTDYYWNRRSGTNMLGTYRGSNGTAANERYVFHKKSDTPDPGPDPGTNPDSIAGYSFPDALHVYLSDGRIDAFPLTLVASHTEANGRLDVETTFGRHYTYDLAEVDSVSENKPTDTPCFESFKFNNSYNDQLFTTANG